MFETDEYLAFVKKSGASLEQMRDETKRALDAHNAEETPNFAKSIESKALSTRVARAARMRVEQTFPKVSDVGCL